MLVSSFSNIPIREEDSCVVVLTSQADGYYSISDCVDLHNNERNLPISIPFKLIYESNSSGFYFDSDFNEDNYISTLFLMCSIKYALNEYLYVKLEDKKIFLESIIENIKEYVKEDITYDNFTEIIEKYIVDLPKSELISLGNNTINKILNNMLDGDIKSFGFTLIDTGTYSNLVNFKNKTSLEKSNDVLNKQLNFVREYKQSNFSDYDFDNLLISTLEEDNFNFKYNKLSNLLSKNHWYISFQSLFGGVEKVSLTDSWLYFIVIYNMINKKSHKSNIFFNEALNLTLGMYFGEIRYSNPMFKFGGYEYKINAIIEDLKELGTYKQVDIFKILLELEDLKNKISD